MKARRETRQEQDNIISNVLKGEAYSGEMASMNNFGYGSGQAPAQSATADAFYGDGREFDTPDASGMPRFVQ